MRAPPACPTLNPLPFALLQMRPSFLHPTFCSVTAVSLPISDRLAPLTPPLPPHPVCSLLRVRGAEVGGAVWGWERASVAAEQMTQLEVLVWQAAMLSPTQLMATQVPWVWCCWPRLPLPVLALMTGLRH